MSFPQVNLAPVLLDELRMQTKGGPDVGRGAAKVTVAFPGPRGGRDGKRVDPAPLAFVDEALEIREEIQVTVEIDEAARHGGSGMAEE